MSARLSEAERLRRCRVVFERALADGCAMAEAGRRIDREEAAERWRRIEAKRRTAHGADATIEGGAPARFFWREGQYA